MRDITARSPQDTLSFSRRHFKWPVLGKSRSSSHGGMSGDEYYMKSSEAEEEEEEEEEEGAMAFSSACPSFHSDGFLSPPPLPQKPRPKAAQAQAPQKEKQQKQRKAKVKTAVARIRSALSAAVSGRRRQVGMGARLAGTLYGHRRGHVHLAFQVDPRACPALLLELAAPTAALVREMASGLVRIALECERGKPKGGAGAGDEGGGGGRRLVEETVWRAYVNGRSCGFAARRECGAADWRVLRALEPVSMGAGVIPAASGGGIEGDVMYMRARFERVVGSRDSEAFYMMNPDNSSGGGGNNGGPELSVYLLRV
ncbi:protein MIZU-KUSSEI 1 [Brachypodium distachyon]|uniref:Protein MIZU-KUSSEI 1 n=1 Tax=Brachypodium distachyon TaxID=15368 RepID=I1HG46_BRADI|nr:protein MIZU-KUSSEI 1 [Brachypodium distachyon]KQK04732.1 hypothetical protein BRADI_2g15590v3 [Brachypodium distachyon]|eukprot:XP_003567838.1 protein MIZU-KUSSEI 1 [Brachypodium distachyon]